MGSVFNCPQCAAEVEVDDSKLSSQCAFCEAPLVRSTDATSKPVDRVAPFDLDRKVASGRLVHFLQSSFWAPNEVRSLTNPEELMPVLVPFWVYDAVARSTYNADIGLYWYETETYTVTVNGRTETRTRQKRHTEWHDLSGSHVKVYSNHLVSGSRGLPEAEANELEPFDLGKALPYEHAMVAGLIAERPSVAHEDARRTATEELAKLENAAIRAFLPGDEKRGVTNHTHVEVEKVSLVLLPVWVAAYKWDGKVFRLLVNGQTGEVVGKVPRSTLKIVIAVVVGVAALLFFLLCMGAFGTVAGAVGGGAK